MLYDLDNSAAPMPVFQNCVGPGIGLLPYFIKVEKYIGVEKDSKKRVFH